MFRIFGEYLPGDLLSRKKVVVVTGVETHGQPVFSAYSKYIERFSEQQFQIFWTAYFLGLIFNKLTTDPIIFPRVSLCQAELARFVRSYRSLGLLEVDNVWSRTHLLQSLCAFSVALVHGIKVVFVDSDGNLAFGGLDTARISERFREMRIPKIEKLDTISCISSLEELMRKSGLQVWVLLDHLDIIFKQRSAEERLALRGLFACARAMANLQIRPKIFLRDDVLENITGVGNEPFVGLSHLVGKIAPRLNGRRMRCVY